MKGKKKKIISLIDYLKATNLENEEGTKRLEECNRDLTQQHENALTIKVGLKSNS